MVLIWLSGIKNIVPDKDGNVSVPDVPVAKMAMIGIMDGIPMQNENGEYIEVEDKTVKTALEEVQIKDLIEIVNGITQEVKDD